MLRQYIKTLTYTIAVLFIIAPLVVATGPLSGKGAKTLQDVGAVQGQDEIVTHGPVPSSTR